MKISILTLFPDMFAPLEKSIIGRARNSGKLNIQIVDIREYSADPHRKCDDSPFGGGSGMVMTPQPVCSCIRAIDPEHKARRVFLSPKGRTLKQSVVTELAACGHLILLCGHYEGVDQRVIDLCIDEELSIGDYVLTGGELAAMVVADCIARYAPGVLGNPEATKDESFSDGTLEYPHYTRPQVFEGLSVPEVLLSGNHAEVEKWRKQQARKITKERRPDLLK